MAKETTITVDHALGADEARARLTARVDWALDQCRQHGFEVKVADWDGHNLPFTAAALGKEFAGTLEVTDDAVRLNLALPFLLRMALPVLEPIAKSYGGRLLRSEP